MASRVYYYAEALSRTTTTSTDFSAVKVTISFTPAASKTYAIFWSALIDHSSTGARTYVRLRNTTTSVDLNAQSANTGATTNIVSVGGVAAYTSGGSPTSQTIELQYAAESTTAGIAEASILVMELGADDKFVETTTEASTTSTTYAASVTLNFTPGSTGDYIIIASTESQRAPSGGENACLRIYNGTTVYSEILSLQGITQGEDYMPYCGMVLASGLSGAQAWEIDIKADVSSDGVKLKNRRVFALRSDGFDNVYSAEDRTSHNSTSSTYADSASVTATPLAFDHVLLATGSAKASTNSTYTGNKINAGGSDVGSTFAAQRCADTSRTNCWIQSRKRTETATSTAWKTQYARAVGSGTATSDENVLAIWQLDAAVQPWTYSHSSANFTATATRFVLGSVADPADFTYTHTAGALYVFVNARVSSVTVSGVTYDGVAMTLVGASAQGGTDPGTISAVYSLYDPGEKTATISVDFSAAPEFASVYVVAAPSTVLDSFGTVEQSAGQTPTVTHTRVSVPTLTVYSGCRNRGAVALTWAPNDALAEAFDDDGGVANSIVSTLCFLEETAAGSLARSSTCSSAGKAAAAAISLGIAPTFIPDRNPMLTLLVM